MFFVFLFRYETKAEFEKQEDFKQYNVDVHRICLGRGQKYYDAGVRAMHKWITLKLGWVEVFPSIPEMVGKFVFSSLKNMKKNI